MSWRQKKLIKPNRMKISYPPFHPDMMERQMSPRNLYLEKKKAIIKSYLDNSCVFKVKMYKILDNSYVRIPCEYDFRDATEYYWVYETCTDKVYAIVRLGKDFAYVKIRSPFERLPCMKVFISDSYDQLIKNALSKSVYKKYCHDIQTYYR